ncbi:unnamed protein product [Rotaria sp. Silwood2]|nr:unnamed protein product [Rotaria sp. Silwood2]CAF3956266.1 unnamed protein product [Rotaria sp. Silwood2]CAF4044335.1 unnamed protein product [Rotaria sp. Silwood2]CAF4084669.1 unnamed protein product [Rotaria sp. Silwood2]
MQLRRDRLTCFSFAIIFCIIILFYQYHYASNESSQTVKFISTIIKNEKFRILPNKYSTIWFKENCFQIAESHKFTVENIPKYLNKARLSPNKICQDFVTKFDALFRLEEIHGSLKLSSIYLKKMKQYFNNNDALIEQIKNQKNIYINIYFLKRIIKIYNRHTHEEMLYNYMRSQRPQTKSEQSAEI